MADAPSNDPPASCIFFGSCVVLASCQHTSGFQAARWPRPRPRPWESHPAIAALPPVNCFSPPTSAYKPPGQVFPCSLPHNLLEHLFVSSPALCGVGLSQPCLKSPQYIPRKHGSVLLITRGHHRVGTQKSCNPRRRYRCQCSTPLHGLIEGLARRLRNG
jgi:hypothetical protein